jgi:A/G-specific adenine glycosylase
MRDDQLTTIEEFRREVWAFYAAHSRDLPWRRTFEPYAIMISEVMLQQTQVARVVPKYGDFLEAFPTVQALAAAKLADVLSAWQGLGYNRRALALHRAAAVIVTVHDGAIPRTVEELRRLPGIGHATAAAICVYAYETPVPFIETNTRAAFIHYFFQECPRVSDAELLPLVAAALDRSRPRDWYYALMDYGAWIKKMETNPSRRSTHHVVQSPFEGSRRQARAAALRAVLAAATLGLSLAELLQAAPPLAARDPEEIHAILADLVSEGFMSCAGGRFRAL